MIVIDPPPSLGSGAQAFEALTKLNVPALSATPSFVWLWVGAGSGDGLGLERGRTLLAHWGFRRCESIAWAKTNKRTVDGARADEPAVGDALLVPTVEHCLMGIRGTVRRSTDGHFVHCNIDADVIIAEPDADGSSIARVLLD